jgi:hypothetical protein
MMGRRWRCLKNERELARKLTDRKVQGSHIALARQEAQRSGEGESSKKEKTEQRSRNKKGGGRRWTRVVDEKWRMCWVVVVSG